MTKVTRRRTRTTFSIDDLVMARLKQEAARQKCTMSSLVEAALRLRLLLPKQSAKRAIPPLPKFRSGGFLVDIDDREALYRAMESD